MCGIFGIVSARDVISSVLEGIQQLEYRGYDSAGIGYISNGQSKAIKSVGEIKHLVQKVNSINPTSTIAIAHTRWATHGAPTEENAHPFVSNNGEFCLVHNGIIENFNELKIKCGGNFSSDTDSEVILKLIEKYFDGDTLATINKVTKLLKGSYALAILSKYEPNKIFVAKKTSPCVIAFQEDEARVCSDISSIGNVDEAYILEDYDTAVLSKDGIEIFDKDLLKKSITPTKVNQTQDTNRAHFDHFMRKEIYDIPMTIRNTCSNYSTLLSLKSALSNKIMESIDRIIIVGCGTAYHAGLIGKKILEEKLDIPISCEIASEFIYSKNNINEHTLTIFVSQSGETADTLKALNIAKENKSKTVAITNVENSSITFFSDFILYTKAEKEVAVASTKAYIGQLTIFYLLAEYFNFLCNNLEDLDNLVISLQSLANSINLLELENIAQEIAQKIYAENDVYMIGRGKDYISALESSLKLKEISYIHSEAYPSGELKHGTISLVENRFIFSFLNEEKLLEKSVSNTVETISRGAKVIIISKYPLDINGIYRQILLPSHDDRYMPIISVIFMQFVAYHTSILRGNNPDKPRALAKSVTVE